MLRTRIGMCAALCIATGSALADDPVATLRAMYPEVRVHNAGRNYHYFHVALMTAGQTESQAAEAFLAQHGAAFGGMLQATGPGAGQPELAEVWVHASKDGTFVAFAYKQRIRGKEVDGSGVRIKVRRGSVPRVGYAAACLAGEPTAGSETAVLSAEAAILTVQALSGIPGQSAEAPPEVVVLRGNAHRPDTWCWRVRTRESEGRMERRRTYYVDTTAPRIVHVTKHFWAHEPPTTGTVEGLGVVAAAPWHPYMGPSTTLVTHRIPAINVQGTVSGPPQTVYTNANGEFSLTNGSSGQAITINASFERWGQWHRMYAGNSTPTEYLWAGATTLVGNDVALTLGNSNSSFTEEMRVAQVDSVVAAARSRAFWHQYISSTTFTLGISPNDPGAQSQCGQAGESAPGLYAVAFAPSLSGVRWNCASHSVVAHEFGHCVLDMLDVPLLTDAGFHEGFGDCYSTMVLDINVQGPSQYEGGINTRNDEPTLTAVVDSFSAHDICTYGACP